MEKTQILVVCMGNICRSPMAEAALRHALKRNGLDRRITVDSAGTHDFNVGSPPDSRAQLAASRRGYDMAGIRARCVERADFERFGMILAMDRKNLAALLSACPAQHRAKLGLFLDYARNQDADEVPDPYFEGPESFEVTLDLIEDAVQGLIDALRRV